MIRENPRCLLPKRHLTPNCASLRNENCVKYIKHLSGSLETQTTTVVSFFFTFPQKRACVMIRYHQMPKLCSWKVSLILIPVEEQREWICTSKKILWWGKRVGALRAIRDKVDSENQKKTSVLVRSYPEIEVLSLFRSDFGSESGNIEQYFDVFELKPIKWFHKSVHGNKVVK